MTARPALQMETAPHEKRRHKRVELILPARFMLPDKTEHSATLINISAGGIALKTDQRPSVSTIVIAYVQDIGRLEGHVVRHLEDGFALEFQEIARLRKRVVERLTFKLNEGALPDPDERLHTRIEMDEQAHLILQDGREVPCRVLDMSFGGVSLAVDERPNVGESITIGRMRGRVVRHHERGIGVAFDTVHASWGSLAGSLR